MWASHWGGFSCFKAHTLGCMGSVVLVHEMKWGQVYRPMIKSMVIDQEYNVGDVLRVPCL